MLTDLRPTHDHLKYVALLPWLALCALLYSHATLAEFSVDSCGPTTDGVTAEIKKILGKQFASSTDSDMQTQHNELEALLVTVGHCSAVVRSNGVENQNREMVIREWHSINQWLSRLTGAVGLTVLGQDGGWREEYALFAEIYEFTP